MYYVVRELVIPMTRQSKLSYAEFVGCGSCSWFVSHFWGDAFCDFVSSLEKHAGEMFRTPSEKSVFDCSGWEKTRYWVCSFSINQHRVEQEIGDGSLAQTSFFKALQSDGCCGTVMVLQEQAQPLRRSWCLFEILQTKKRQDRQRDGFKGFFLATHQGMLNTGSAPIGMVTRIAREVRLVDLADAKASRLEDKQMIDKAVVDSDGCFTSVNLFVRGVIMEAVKSGKEAMSYAMDTLIEDLHEVSGKPLVSDDSQGSMNSTEAKNAGAPVTEIQRDSVVEPADLLDNLLNEYALDRMLSGVC
jgi:hypothetical protein